MTVASAPQIEVGVVACGLTKRFGDAVAVRDASFALPSKGVVGLLGPNGAGKTTTIRMIAGVLAPDGGELFVAGASADREPALVRARVGYLPESAPTYPELTVREYLSFRASLVGLTGASASGAIAGAMERCDVARFADRLCGLLSKGMQQRVGLAATVLGEPRVVILDEPSVGLDPGQTLAFRQLVRELGESRLVLFSSHLLAEVESVCDQLVVIARGTVVAHEPMERFRARAAQGGRYFVESERGFAAAAIAAGMIADPAESRLADGWTRTEFAASGADDPRIAVGRLLAEVRIPVRAMGVEAQTLEQVFVSMVREANR
ncbi:MAG: gliding motility-associated transporter ATP-binding subunit GldA [Planctomycetota bacterium]